MHQGSALSPLLFVIVMETVSGEIRVSLARELLYTDDLVVIAKTENDLTKGGLSGLSGMKGYLWP